MPDALLANPPYKRFRYVARIYGDKHPDIVLDTFLVLADAVGIDRPEVEFGWADLWQDSWGPLRRRVWDGDGLLSPLPRRSSKDLSRFRSLMADSPSRWGPAFDPHKILARALEQLADDPRMQRGRASDALWPWVAKELHRIKKDRAYGLNDYLDTLEELEGKGPALALWQQKRRVDLGRYRLEEALAELKDFEVEATDVPQGEIVFEWDDGWTVQRLITPFELDVEGEVMQHCVADYCEEVQGESVFIYSLRDPRGKPHVTIEYDPQLERFLQVYGKQNTEPKPEYMRRVETFADELGVKPFGALTDEEKSMAASWGRRLAEEAWRTLEESVRQFPTVAQILSGEPVQASLADLDDESVRDLIARYPREAGAYGDYGEPMVAYQFAAMDEGGLRRGPSQIRAMEAQLDVAELVDPLLDEIKGGFADRWGEFGGYISEGIDAAIKDAVEEISEAAPVPEEDAVEIARATIDNVVGSISDADREWATNLVLSEARFDDLIEEDEP